MRRLKRYKILAVFGLTLLALWGFGGCEPIPKGGYIVIIPPAGAFRYNVEICYNYTPIGRYMITPNNLKICAVELDGDYQVYYNAAPGKPTRLLARVKITGGDYIDVKIPTPAP